MALNFKSKVGGGKVIIVILGLLIAGLGCYSHFTSSWLTKEAVFNNVIYLKPYELCNIAGVENCPKIIMERIFVAIIIITLILSVCNLIVTFLVNMENGTRNHFDCGYHIVAGILMLIASILYFSSALQIHDIFKDVELIGDWHFRRTEKLISAGLALIQGGLFITVGFYIRKKWLLKNSVITGR